PLPAAEAERLGRLDLACFHRLDAGAENLRNEGRIADGQCDDRAPKERHIAYGQRIEQPKFAQRRGDEIPAGNKSGSTDEGYPEEQYQYWYAADDLHIEPCNLVRPARTGQRH